MGGWTYCLMYGVFTTTKPAVGADKVPSNFAQNHVHVKKLNICPVHPLEKRYYSIQFPAYYFCLKSSSFWLIIRPLSS
ncbi:hypothetical protein DFA_01861 [Cavenderia fasciculata]|uniref:Uncharacterized protein n=1 Tax=Cavenderia fasciculata TaxID=261658 RepID=F4PV67_CACFS|nr:uncharacterized protein DFA_01861 [Cavenderia fasciculata]EGG21975.1 hypothetical protein DFA_01861 [Cavenderia fasciculata]|eukprot:XP_004359826.1 hypothetical protein DFA_01861 [Cavenderia fasciculata]